MREAVCELAAASTGRTTKKWERKKWEQKRDQRKRMVEDVQQGTSPSVVRPQHSKQAAAI